MCKRQEVQNKIQIDKIIIVIRFIKTLLLYKHIHSDINYLKNEIFYETIIAGALHIRPRS